MSDLGNPGDIDALVAKLADALQEHLARNDRDAPLMVGVHTGGVWVARKLHHLLAVETPLGTLNINFYRDDFTRIGMHPMVTPSDLFSVDDRHVVRVVHGHEAQPVRSREASEDRMVADDPFGELVEVEGPRRPGRPGQAPEASLDVEHQR